MRFSALPTYIKPNRRELSTGSRLFIKSRQESVDILEDARARPEASSFILKAPHATPAWVRVL